MAGRKRGAAERNREQRRFPAAAPVRSRSGADTQAPPGSEARSPGDADAGDRFEHPLSARYASPEMLRLWSPRSRVLKWRQIWVALAEAQHELELPVTKKQIAELRAMMPRIDLQAAAAYEGRTRHDVMAQIHAFGDVAPSARGILHLGATSMDVVDNADLLLMREGLEILQARLVGVIRVLARFCKRYADLPTLGYTHLQPAQLTTVGRRAALWLADLCDDLKGLDEVRRGLRCRGLRGATGTQASFLKLLKSPAKVRRLERRFARKLGFDACYPITGQTYSRKVDVTVIAALASLAASAHKICNDLRLLAMLKEIEEPIEAEQVGSSAMPYKRNPMRCERATGLARYLLSLLTSPYMTLAAQMLERTLDDSSNKRLVVPEAFLAADALLVLLHNILDGLVVYPAMIEAHLQAELPFIASENILLEAVAAGGGDRQRLHERIRQHAIRAADQVKRASGPNDLVDRLRADPAFAAVDWARVLDPRKYVGLAPQQTRAYLSDVVAPLLRRKLDTLVSAAMLRV